MPKIDAPTVAEHRAQVQAKLVDAAEEILRAQGAQGLTAHAVSSAAGIARNSIYRYVDSVDDLTGMVLERHLPAWLAAVEAELAGISDPGERIVVWVGANLRQAARSGHGWLMGLGRLNPSPVTQRVMDTSHRHMRETLAGAWDALQDEPLARVAAGLTRGILDAGFRELDHGSDAELVIRSAETAARAVVSSLRR